MKKYLIPFTLTLFLFSCTKEISITLPEVPKKIVVDGGIYAGDVAEINLTWSTGYFDPIDSASLANYLIQSATAYVTDGNLVDTLHLSYDPLRAIPIVWKGANIIGQAGHTYVLTVIADGQTATATTKIYPAVPLDSVWFRIEPNQDTLGFAWAHLTDPVGIGNGYRWFSKRVGVDDRFRPPFGSAFDDRFIEGQSFDFAYNRPSDPGSTAPEDTNGQAGFFKVGDVIAVQFCTIGQAEVNFFRTFEEQVGNNGNPFAAPGEIETNVHGGLGIFCGYNPSYDTIYCH
ncbi:MAG TPA: DUF4249 domain-containing protein [Bacteroidia bacterium]|jgi:hypothetical protein|nr:DUF4249 domain-containing protein [Bacteroidia bacterium]